MNDKKDDERILLSYSAPKLQRYIHDTWIVDLSKFSDHIKSLGVVEAAVIKVQTADQRDNLTLITFRKYPAFKDFQVEAQSGNGTGDKEKLLVSWIPQRNDPVTQRTLYIFPAEKPELSEKHRLTDGSLPPFEIQMEPPQKPALWCASMETNQSRFHTVTATFCPRVSFQWFRAPDDWVDWLDWHDSTAEAIQARVGSLKNLKQDFKEKVIPWSYFLLHFHFDKGKDCLNVIRSILGDSALEYLLPYSRGQIWDIRTALTTRVSVEIASSTIEARAWEDHLTYRYPYYWHKIPEEVDMELSLCSDHKYLGPAGALWKFKKAATNKIANLVSEEGSPLDLPIWLEDALEPDREGSLVARCPLRAIWNYPIHLPILKNIQQENRSWSEIEKKERPPLPPKIQPTSIHRSFAALRELLHCQNKGKPSNTYRETVHPQISQNSKDFAKQWMNWAETVNQNRFLSLLILGRLQAMGPIGLSGPVALISRFRSRGIWIEQISKMHTAYEQSIDNLYKSSLQFVIKNTPKAFLKDLILSEIIISWYWDQNLAKI